MRRADNLLGTTAGIFQVMPEHPEIKTPGSSRHRVTGLDPLRGAEAAPARATAAGHGLASSQTLSNSRVQ